MADWTPSAKLPAPALYERFVGSLGSELVAKKPSAAPGSVKPFEITCMPPLPSAVRVYLFNCTEHPAERRRGDYRIQLKLPGQRKGERGRLATEPSVFVLLAGYVAEFDVFVLWDAAVHSDFAFSKGVQVGAPAIHHAAIYGIGTQRRRVRPGSGTYIEQVVAARADRLEEGVIERRRLTQQSLLSQPNPGEDVMIYD